MASLPVVALNGALAGRASRGYLERKALAKARIQASKLCRRFCTLGWASSAGGGIAVEVRRDSVPRSNRLIAAGRRPGARKDRVMPDYMYGLSANGSILPLPSPKLYSSKPPRCMSCLSFCTKAEGYHFLFNDALELHHLGLNNLIPNHGLQQTGKGAASYANIRTYVKAGALNSDNRTEPLPRCVVLDIEGTTTPISFVTDVLFPYARDNVGRHLSATFETPETRDDIKLLRSQVEDDLKQGVQGAVPIPGDEAGKEQVIAALVANVEAMIKADRKITALKQLQGHIWQTGFENNELEGVVFEDVPKALTNWHSLGIKVYIYSSGSRLAQRLIFGKTNYGDLRKYLCGFFDTYVGNKKETRSYIEISESLGVDKPSDVLFLTDVYQEAVAAKDAGLKVLILIRPGNGPLPENHGFKTVSSFLEI
ncbi:probable bifunctional methylthioribulose-1-phosphate dehydratase/enolase-phosphatase E1 isoform X1 [Eucalyptus grandis]|uniref:probable bifunctional methylthioribulose-1-phosphate dehydratase/enolase-phosphatase E1 isoform X1 n=1 Tax=Eucalyptus grandis TaxID=71139 RepID=UPI00192F0D04|nr:probable bifunctional methylthioribulose-1-phosphate dehydratase/enolase-phosphatase E1 isoform X1 [Eucalyptus grandis]XP_018731899.2 probable bifunctional methylthioribulose-1-phosphate dehydratase/enolase-phosphatase E1 isoform X1 [Eucalyptus grandis]